MKIKIDNRVHGRVLRLYRGDRQVAALGIDLQAKQGCHPGAMLVLGRKAWHPAIPVIGFRAAHNLRLLWLRNIQQRALRVLAGKVGG